MPSVSFNGNSGGSVLSLQWDGITVAGTNGYLQNPRIQFYCNAGFSDTHNSIHSIGSAVTNQLVRDASHGALNGGTRTWPLTATAIPLTVGAPTYSSFGARVYGISFFNGDQNTNDYWSGNIEYPALQNPGPGGPVEYSSGLDYGVAVYELGPNRAKARIWIPSNGRPIRIRAEGNPNDAIDMTVRFARLYHPYSNEQAMHASGTEVAEMTLYPGTNSLYLDVKRAPLGGYLAVTLAYL